MPQTVRTLFLDRSCAVALLDSAAEITIVRKTLRRLLEVGAIETFITVETTDTRVASPDRLLFGYSN